MTAKIPCYIEFSDSGYFLRVVHRSGFIIGEFLISDGNLCTRSLAAHDRLGKQSGIPEQFREPQNPYRGSIEQVLVNDVIREEIENLEGMISNWYDTLEAVKLEESKKFKSNEDNDGKSQI